MPRDRFLLSSQIRKERRKGGSQQMWARGKKYPVEKLAGGSKEAASSTSLLIPHAPDCRD